MPAFRQGDVVKVPFPYTDRATRQHRPALVLSSGKFEASHGLLWVLMITSAENRGWSGDVPIDRYEAAGLPAPSIIRTAKVAMIEAADAIKLGRVPPALLETVLAHVSRTIGVRNR